MSIGGIPLAESPPAGALPSLHFVFEVDDAVVVGVDAAVVVEVAVLVVEGAEDCSNILIMPSLGLLLPGEVVDEEIPSLILNVLQIFRQT